MWGYRSVVLWQHHYCSQHPLPHANSKASCCKMPERLLCTRCRHRGLIVDDTCTKQAHRSVNCQTLILERSNV